jgi:hypothetical protein
MAQIRRVSEATGGPGPFRSRAAWPRGRFVDGVGCALPDASTWGLFAPLHVRRLGADPLSIEPLTSAFIGAILAMLVCDPLAYLTAPRIIVGAGRFLS